MKALTKKKWANPELLVVVRSRPAEAVLTWCKHIQGGSTGPNFNVSDCASERPYPGQDCSGGPCGELKPS